MTDLHTSPEHRFSFGLPPSPGPDPTRDSAPLLIEPWDFVHGLAEIGAWGVAIHDDELFPPGATPQERHSVLGKFQAALDNTGVAVSMFATDLSRHPAFAGGAFTAPDGDVRRCALQKSLRAVELGAELGAPIHVLNAAHEGIAATAAGTPTDALDRYREAINFLCGRVRDQDYPITLALAPGAGEPTGNTVLPTIGHALAFIEMLDHPDMVGLLPTATLESSQSTYRGVAQAIWSGRLAAIDLNATQGSAGLKDMFFLVKILEESGYLGPRHFGPRPYRGEYGGDVWDFAAGCMRTYSALAAKVRRFADDPDIQAAVAEAGVRELSESAVGRYSTAEAQQLAGRNFDLDALVENGHQHDRLDRLITDLLLGLR